MKRSIAYLWGFAVLAVGVLNIFDVLPDYATYAAILTLPFIAAVTGAGCRSCGRLDKA